jgi:diguanylate cyclase (GGDEF)-like protein
VLVAHNYSTARKWQEWEIAFLQKLSTQVTLAIQQSELYAQLKNANQQLRQLAILDGLTGIANRRYFDRILNKEWKRLTREQQPLSLLLCDIDYFKDYNDTYGHPSGDRCLTEVAAVLKQATKRAADLVARYGGEEFAVILPNTNAKGALVVANAIRQKLHKLQLPHGKSAVSKYVTLSIGSATKIPNPNQNPSSLIKMADDALYRAKKAGRDRILQHKKSVVLNI